MQLKWLKYRELTADYIRGANVYARNYNLPILTYDGISISPAKLQVLEYILENEENNLPMSALAEKLGITRGAFSTHVSELKEMGLLVKKHPDGNAKVYHLEVSEKGKTLYNMYSASMEELAFHEIDDMLDALSPEEYEKFAAIVKTVTQKLMIGKTPNQ